MADIAIPSPKMAMKTGTTLVTVTIATFVLVLATQHALADAAVGASENSNFTVISGSTNTLNTTLSASDQEKLKIAAKTGESHTVNITDNVSLKLIFSQERVAISLDCLPWLQRIKRNRNGELKIQWYYRQLTETGHGAPASNRTRLVPTPENRLDFQRIVVGGESNRWLNISQTVAVPGAEDPDNKIFICRIATPDEEVYYESSLELRMVGAPPVIIRGNGSGKQLIHHNYH